MKTNGLQADRTTGKMFIIRKRGMDLSTPLCLQNPFLSHLKQLSAYSKKLIEGVLEDRKNLQSELTSHLKKGWRLERVSQTVVAIMEVALFEINHSDEIDAKAAVNEALNLCDEFAEPKEKPFINGMLANFVK